MVNKLKRFPNNDSNKKPTMKDVAQLANVSVSTVSHFINGTHNISRKTAHDVEEAIRSLNFRINSVAQNLRSGKSKIIGFIISNIENYFYVRIAKGIEKVLNQYGYHLILINSSENKKNEISNIESLYLRGAEGIIIVPTNSDCNFLNEMLGPDYPLIFVDRQPINYEADKVLLANYEAAYQATKYLVKKGHTHIGFIAFHYGEEKIDFTMQERVAGYTKALEEAGIPVNPEYLKTVAQVPESMLELRYSESYHLMAQLRSSPVSAILCGNSLAAVGVVSYLKDNGVRIPEDVSVITFDDDPWMIMSTPSITAVSQPAELMGSIAAKRILSRIHDANMPKECIRLKADLILRDSS